MSTDWEKQKRWASFNWGPCGESIRMSWIWAPSGFPTEPAWLNWMYNFGRLTHEIHPCLCLKLQRRHGGDGHVRQGGELGGHPGRGGGGGGAHEVKSLHFGPITLLRYLGCCLLYFGQCILYFGQCI